MDQAENLRRLAGKQETPSPGPVMLTVVSGKGGTGKTSFCINFAIALAAEGKSVMIIDADFGLSNVDVMLGARPKHHIGDVLSGNVSLGEAAAKGHGDIWYIAGGAGVEELMDMNPEKLAAIQEEIAGMDVDLDYIIFDCGAGVNNLVLGLMAATDESLLLLTPEPTALTDAYVLMKTLIAGKARPIVRFVMNRAENPVEAITMARHFKNIVRKYLAYDVGYLGYISFDRNVVQSIKKQMPLMLSYPSSLAAKDIRHIAQQYTETEERKGGGFRRLLDRLMSWHGE